jgi:hypothetical protein
VLDGLEQVGEHIIASFDVLDGLIGIDACHHDKRMRADSGSVTHTE